MAPNPERVVTRSADRAAVVAPPDRLGEPPPVHLELAKHPAARPQIIDVDAYGFGMTTEGKLIFSIRSEQGVEFIFGFAPQNAKAAGVEMAIRAVQTQKAVEAKNKSSDDSTSDRPE